MRTIKSAIRIMFVLLASFVILPIAMKLAAKDEVLQAAGNDAKLLYVFVDEIRLYNFNTMKKTVVYRFKDFFSNKVAYGIQAAMWINSGKDILIVTSTVQDDRETLECHIVDSSGKYIRKIDDKYCQPDIEIDHVNGEIISQSLKKRIKVGARGGATKAVDELSIIYDFKSLDGKHIVFSDIANKNIAIKDAESGKSILRYKEKIEEGKKSVFGAKRIDEKNENIAIIETMYPDFEKSRHQKAEEYSLINKDGQLHGARNAKGEVKTMDEIWKDYKKQSDEMKKDGKNIMILTVLRAQDSRAHVFEMTPGMNPPRYKGGIAFDEDGRFVFYLDDYDVQSAGRSVRITNLNVCNLVNDRCREIKYDKKRYYIKYIVGTVGDNVVAFVGDREYAQINAESKDHKKFFIDIKKSDGKYRSIVALLNINTGVVKEIGSATAVSEESILRQK